ncbi:beta-glucosidase 12-like [Cornus florida]|uniref:beta-glucosidase 12-like n=1 Tax=Cornus florida TaxID=4283 RepID=UPI00289CB1CB|nr:beta-glucosidase 12-like [Cornus florida]
MIKDGSNGDVAIDSYHLYPNDSSMMRTMGVDAYRFSISWSRILPSGNLAGGLNEEGIQYYNNFIDDLIAKGIQPYATLFHWDVPQALEDAYDGFVSPQIVDDFRDFADVCFWKFGDRVKNWITLNEPWSFSSTGYGHGTYAPGRCSPWQNCTRSGDSSTEPYLVSHHQLLAHLAAVELYRKNYQACQEGIIGITLLGIWYEPLNASSRQDIDAQKRAIDFVYGWFMDPLTNGDYPRNMRDLVGNRLPNFTTDESTRLIGSFDFLGLNYYTAGYATYDDNDTRPDSYVYDSKVITTYVRDGIPIGENASSWLYIYPLGFRNLLNYTKMTYNISLIYITENGVNDDENADSPQIINDTRRVKYLKDHLCCLQKSIFEDDVNVKGYFVWSMMDNFEWVDGYTTRFGINYVDYDNNLTRTPKSSAIWLQGFLNGSTQSSTSLKLIADQ